MVVYKESFVSKIRKFFNNLFSMKEQKIQNIKIETEIKQEKILEEK